MAVFDPGPHSHTPRRSILLRTAGDFVALPVELLALLGAVVDGLALAAGKERLPGGLLGGITAEADLRGQLGAGFKARGRLFGQFQ